MRSSGKQSVPEGPRQAHDPVAGFAASIAHDLSNLLLVIHSSAVFLREDLPTADPRSEHVTALLDAAERARRLATQLQAFGRGQLLKPELVRPATIVRQLNETLREIVPADIDFRVSVRAAQAVVIFDVAQLQVVIMNLVAVAAEQVRTRGRLLLSVASETVHESRTGDGVPPGEYVIILITADGAKAADSGGASAFGPRLASRQLPSGTDLRLASAHGIVTQSGGFMDSSSDAHGSTLHVYLPRSTAGVPAERPRRNSKADHSGSEIILLVEDDAAVRSIVRTGLERYGYTVYEATNGAEALHVTQLFNALPDLLIADLVMPEVTGRELIEGLRHEGRLPRVLLMSGYTDDEVLRRAAPSDTYPFLKKPFTHKELAAKVREVLDAPHTGS